VLTMAEVGTSSGALRKSAATDVRIECPMSVGMEPNVQAWFRARSRLFSN
jgi:hypothetical protein